MPFVTAKVSVPISSQQELELKTRLGKAISLIPNKSEEYLLLSFEDNCRLWLRGKKDAVAYVTADIFGNEDHIGFAEFAAAATDALHEILKIPPENVYIKLDDIRLWSAAGNTFDRRMFM